MIASLHRDFLLIEPYASLGFGVKSAITWPGRVDFLPQLLYRVSKYHTGDFAGEFIGFVGVAPPYTSSSILSFKVLAAENGALLQGETVEVDSKFCQFRLMEKLVMEEAFEEA